MSVSLPITSCVPIPDDQKENGFGALRTHRGNLPLKALAVQSHIEGLIARTVMTQSFVNVLDEPLEATYIFPLPDQAAVTRFIMRIGERTIEAKLKERGAARREYIDALEKGHRATIAEEDRPGVFTIRVGNIAPGETAEVELVMVGPLEYSGGEATFRFPLVVAPRYIPGTALGGSQAGSGTQSDTDQTPDASRITPPVLLPGFPNPVRLSMTVDVSSTTAAKDLRSTLHAISEGSGDGGTRVTLRPEERLDRDFILRFRIADADVRTSLIVQRDEKGDEGTFMLTVVPPAETGTTRARDVVFLLDRSGSMEGWKMVAARRALGRMIDSLTDRDRFFLLGFDTDLAIYGGTTGRLQPATNRERFRAVEFLSSLNAAGGTEMLPALQRGVQELDRSGSAGNDRILVLITDGQVGNEDAILQSLGSSLSRTRTYTLGIDRAVNAAFLKRLAQAGGGWSVVVESEDRLDEVMDRMNRNIGTAVATELTLQPSGFAIQDIVPRRMPELFADRPVMLMGRYRGDAASMRVSFVVADGESRSREITPQPAATDAVVSLWARGQVRALEDDYASHGDNKGVLEPEIVRTSIRYGVLSRFTAFVGVDESEVVYGSEEMIHVMQPVEIPDGWATHNACLSASDLYQEFAEIESPRPDMMASSAFVSTSHKFAYDASPIRTLFQRHSGDETDHLVEGIRKKLNRRKGLAAALLGSIKKLEELFIALLSASSPLASELKELLDRIRLIDRDATDESVTPLKEQVMVLFQRIGEEKSGMDLSPEQTTREEFWK